MDYRVVAETLCNNLPECEDCQKCFPQMATYCREVVNNSGDDPWPTCQEMIYNYLKLKIEK